MLSGIGGIPAAFMSSHFTWPLKSILEGGLGEYYGSGACRRLKQGVNVPRGLTRYLR